MATHVHTPPSFTERLSRQLDAIAHGTTAFALSLGQEHFLFPKNRRTPGENGLREMLMPEDYPQLKGRGIVELQLTDPANGNIPVTVWERDAEPGKPHYLLFHGQAGHWADGGPAPKERYDDIETGRSNGLQFLQAISETGAGFTAVCLRGYGKTPGEPSEKAFNEDIAVVINHLMRKQIPQERMIVGGESLGTASALEAAAQMTERGYAPAQVDLMNPFATMAEISAESFDKIRELRHVPHLSADFLEHHLLRHHFDNRTKLARLSKRTTVHIATCTKDSKIDPHHSDDLYALAGDGNAEKGIVGLHLDAVHSDFPNSNHRDWCAPHLLAKSIRIYNARHGLDHDDSMLQRLETHDYSCPPMVIPKKDWRKRTAPPKAEPDSFLLRPA